jgi:conserved oligomeric Golgi complex subunit 6
VQSEVTVAPADLSPPEFLDEALRTVKALAKSYDTSTASSDEEHDSFQSVLAETLDPFLSGCENLFKQMPAPNSDIFAINCLSAAKAALTGYTFADDRANEMEDTIGEHTAKLIEYQHRYLASSSGLTSLLEALADISDTTESLKTISSLDAFQPDALVGASQQLDEFLPSALIDAAENIGQLQNRKLVQDITEEAAGRFCEDFEYVESKIVAADDLVVEDEDDKADEPKPTLRDLFPRTSGEIRVLLS